MQGLNRRGFISALAGGAAGCVGEKLSVTRHRSDYNGVQIGTITYSFRAMRLEVGSTLRHTLEAGLGTVELMAADLERDLGIPYGERGYMRLSESQRHEVLQWRQSVDPGRYSEIRSRYRDAGIDIHCLKFGGIGDSQMEDWELDYCFRVAQAMGVKAITREVPNPKDFANWKRQAMRLKPYMENSGIRVAFHNHLQIDSKSYDGPLLDWSDHFMINFDIGHYLAANDDDPLEFVKKYHDRIESIHIKDRTTKSHGQKNLAFGMGDTPLKGLFSLIKRERWNFPCDIELEYEIPAGSDAVKEVGLCNRYCRNVIFG